MSPLTTLDTFQLCLWILTIPLPKIPPIVVAAVACGLKDSAEALTQMHFQLDALLHQHGIHSISLASDGTETERQAQDLICQSASDHLVFSITNSTLGCELHFKIPLAYGQHPFVKVQDSKHAAKTCRNQLMTGARNIVISNFFTCFAQLRELAANPLGPLFLRDVEKLDRQDDCAAARLLSAAALDFNLSSYPNQRALLVYLFIFGELIDAWQNQNISHPEHAKMVM